MTDGTAGRAAAAWTTTADGDDLAGLNDRFDSDTVAPYRSALGMPWAKSLKLYTVSQKMHQLWNGIAKNYKDQFCWYLAEIFKRL